MSLFNWFSGKASPSPTATDKDHEPMVRGSVRRSRATRDKTALLPPARLAVETGKPGEERKVKRHARREQLYMAVREAFTHAGVLSATYRFKVLSLDQAGNEFLVMTDVDQSFDHRAEKLAEVEAKIVQIAKSRYEISVTSVYWRVSTSATARGTKSAPIETVPADRKAPNLRYDPIQDDEVAAFKQALVAASAGGLASSEAAARSRSGSRSYTLLTGFEDTEMAESPSAPVLSATQYGDLN